MTLTLNSLTQSKILHVKPLNEEEIEQKNEDENQVFPKYCQITT